MFEYETNINRPEIVSQNKIEKRITFETNCEYLLSARWKKVSEEDICIDVSTQNKWMT